MCICFAGCRYACGHFSQQEITIRCRKADRDTPTPTPGSPCTAWFNDTKPFEDVHKCRSCDLVWATDMIARARDLIHPYSFQLTREQKVWLADVRANMMDNAMEIGGEEYVKFEIWQDIFFLEMIESMVPLQLPRWALARH